MELAQEARELSMAEGFSLLLAELMIGTGEGGAMSKYARAVVSVSY